MFLSLKVIVSVILMLNFSVPLWALVTELNHSEDAMIILVINMTLVNFVFSLVFFAMGISDVAFFGDVPLPLCATLHYLLLGVFIAGKVAAFFLAVDQFVAVADSLRYNTLMDVWTGRMRIITWSAVPLVALVGVVSYHLDLETAEEFDRRMYGTERVLEFCSWDLHAHVVMLISEALVFLLSLSSACLFVYTAIIGMQHEKTLARRRPDEPESFFILRLKSFRRIIKVLIVLLAVDIIGVVIRIASRWSPQIELKVLNVLRILCVAVEGWTYGLNNPAVRRTIRNILGFTNEIEAERQQARQPVVSNGGTRVQVPDIDEG